MSDEYPRLQAAVKFDHLQMRRLANKIARDLITAGNGQRGDRLAIVDQNNRELAGWGEVGAAQQIYRTLKGE